MSIPYAGKKNKKDPCLAKFLGRNGLDRELEAAMKVFIVGHEYRVIAGSMGQSHTTLRFDKVEGGWNSVMFDLDIHNCPAIPMNYRSSISAITGRRNRRSK